MELDRDSVSKFKCNDCQHICWTSLNGGCKNCNSQNLVKPTEEEVKAFDDAKWEKELSNAMSEHTDLELVSIIKVKRNDYRPEAIKVAEKELKNRQLNADQIEQLHQEAIEISEKRDENINEEKDRTRKNLLIAFGIIVLLFLTGVLSITTEGCTLPIDIVLFDTCLLGSFGASLGATLAATIAITIGLAILGFVIKLITRLLR